MKISSTDRVRAALAEYGHEDTITEFPEGTRSADDAAEQWVVRLHRLLIHDFPHR